MHLYTFTRQPDPEAPPIVETSSFSDDLAVVDTLRDFADIWGTAVSVVLQTGHRVTVEPRSS